MVGAAVSISGLLMIALAVSSDPVSDWVILFFIGGTWEALWVTAWSTAHFRSPEGLSGEAMGLLLMTSSLGVTVGAIAVGQLFDTVGVAEALLGIGIVLLVFGIIPALVGRRVSDPA
jgi:predicted MFS family arabinose efflux permease